MENPKPRTSYLIAQGEHRKNELSNKFVTCQMCTCVTGQRNYNDS